MRIAVPKGISKNETMLWLTAAVIGVLLVMRDYNQIPVNKYLFLMLTGLAVICLNFPTTVSLVCFLMPLYYGLPGNYITLLLLARFALELPKMRIYFPSFLFFVCTAVFVLAQNVYFGYTGIVQMMYVPGLLLILLLFSYRGGLDREQMIMMYTVGVFLLGVIMLMCTLREFDLADILSSSFRLGTVSYSDEGAMNVSVDPNFYGMCVISALSLAMPVVLQKAIGPVRKAVLITGMLGSLFVCLVGLSRSFILVLFVWALVYTATQRGFGRRNSALILTALCVIVMVRYFPDIVEAVMTRFASDDMATGNGRVDKIASFFAQWTQGIGPFLFGVGFFDCNVHCTPLQFLFGGGLIMAVFVVGFCLSIYTVSFSYRAEFFEKWLPMLATLTMSLTIPAAQQINALFPLVIVGMDIKLRRSKKSAD